MTTNQGPNPFGWKSIINCWPALVEESFILFLVTDMQ